MQMAGPTTAPPSQGESLVHPSPRTPPRPPSTSATTPTSSHRRSKMPSPSPTPSKLRRKVSIEDALESAAGIQRLVEYFVVVSSLPRWEQTPAAPPSPSPDIRRPETRRSVSAPAQTIDTATATPATTTSTHTPTISVGPKKSPLQRSNTSFWNKDKDGSPSQSRASSSDSQSPSQSQSPTVQESREEILPPPKPNGTWKRDTGSSQDGTPGNIHLPSHHDEDYTFQPKITARFPVRDHANSPLNPMVTQFCHPVGDVIVPTKDYQMPRIHYFVLTNDKGRKLYGTCLTIYEEYEPPPDAPSRAQHLIHSDSGERDIEVTMDDQESTLYLPRCLCIISIWPYMQAFREYLSQLYRLATTTDCMEAPIERYILNLCMEVPAPPPGAFEVQINILDSVIRFWSPPAKLPIAYVALPYKTLFECLDVQNILHIWYCLTTEQKVLLVSSQYSILTVCAEILCSLLYPMKWSHLYVPLLPRFLCPMLDAPVPYLCGVTRDNWLYVQQFVSDETIVVDLDRNSVMFGPYTQELPALPGKKWRKLHKSLEDTVGHLFWKTRGLEAEYRQSKHQKIDSTPTGDLRWNEKLQTFDQAFNLQFTPDSENLGNGKTTETGQNQWDRVQEAFLRFFVAMLKDYRSYIEVPSQDAQALSDEAANDWLRWSNGRKFDREKFISSQKLEYYPFLSQLTLTQQFDDFITKRLYSPEMPDIIFFDQSIDAKLNRSRLKLKKVETPFLHSAKAHKVLKTFTAIAPNTSGVQPSKPYVYKKWPENLNAQLFGNPRPIPSIITAEFDRQAALVSQLRSNYTEDIAAFSHLFELYGSDFDSSPEGMTFTVFFYAYSAIIGREWQVYQEKQRELEADINMLQKEPEAPIVNGEKEEEPQEMEAVEVHIPDSSELFGDLSLGMCEHCPDRTTVVDSTLLYMAANPCPRQIDELNSQAQIAYDTLSQFTNASLQKLQNPRASSLLDDDECMAEYEEARAVAVAQLDLAFDTLKTMELRGLSSDPDVFKSLMEACGRCGDTKRALELIETMKRDGLAADPEILSCFMAAFAHNSGENDMMELAELSLGGRHGSDAYSNYLRKMMKSVGHDNSDVRERFVYESECEGSATDVASSSGSDMSAGVSALNQPLGSGIMEWLAPSKSKKGGNIKRYRRKKKSSKVTKEPATDRLLKQVVLGKALLDFLYPNLKIDTEAEACMHCSHIMDENDVTLGWRPCGFEDFTTCCPKCHHRFVPRFSVSCTSPTFEGSQGQGTPLYCEFLSPWVLRKELSHLITSERGIDVILDTQWRSGTDIKATIWWNLVAMFQRYDLPISFLLQGSFQNRLINPVPQDEVQHI